MPIDQIHTNSIGEQSVSAPKLSSGAALSNMGFTPVNKAGDTMTGPLIVGDVSLGRIEVNIMALWRSSDMQGYTSFYNDGGGISYAWDNSVVRVDNSVGSHNWDVGRIRIPAGTYRLAMHYRPSPSQHGWNVYGSNSNAHIIRLQSDAGFNAFNTFLEIRAQLNKDSGHSQLFMTGNYVVNSTTTFRIGMQTDPYGTGGFKYYVESAYLIKVA